MICPVLYLSGREAVTISGAFQLNGVEAGSEKDTEVGGRQADRR